MSYVKLCHIVNLFHIIFQSIQSCPNPYKLHGESCIFDAGQIANICDAWKICMENSGVIIMEKDWLSGIDLKSGTFWVGINDLSKEQFDNKSGWINSSGIEFTNLSFWRDDEPNNPNGEDCVIMSHGGKLRDIICHGKTPRKTLCSWHPQITSKRLKVVLQSNVEMFNNDRDSGCYDYYDEGIEEDCPMRCLDMSLVCKAFYFDEDSKKCVVVLYIDSSLPNNYGDISAKWKKYKVVKQEKEEFLSG